VSWGLFSSSDGDEDKMCYNFGPSNVSISFKSDFLTEKKSFRRNLSIFRGRRLVGNVIKLFVSWQNKLDHLSREALMEGGRLSAIDLLVLTILLLFILKRLFNYVTKQATLMRRSTVLSIPLQLVFTGLSLASIYSLVKYLC
jgi:hypothetical protein